ncbi:MAG: tripartite tricarboxylate transporter substrate binding protein [Burkholderiaceae bacterium]|nr:tripartite tricarboxylate transporter substrate binding protein [Burkholderiaceae bacterium]
MPHTFPRRAALALAAFTLLGAPAAQAQGSDYPNKPIRLIAPFPTGSGPDANAREIAAELTKVLGQTVIVDNRPGAAGLIGTDAGAKAAPDGYTLLVGTTSSMSVLPHIQAKLPFHVERDFAPVSLLGLLNTGLIAHPAVPFQTAKELIAQAKAKPDSITVGVQGIGSYSHLAGEWFAASAAAPLKFVPYNTTSVYGDLLAGQVQLMFDGLPAAVGNIRGGKLKLLALTGKARHPAFPDTPTFAEAGLPDYAPTAWQGILAPAATPRAIIEKLSAAMQKAVQNPQLAEKWRNYGGELKATTPAEFAAFLKQDNAMWGKAIREAGVKID